MRGNKIRKMNKILYIFFGIFLTLFLLILIFGKRVEEFNILINHPYLCIKTDLGYEEVMYFAQNEDKYICGRITSTADEYKVRISQYIFFKNPNSVDTRSFSDKEAEFYEMIWFSSTDSAIPLYEYLPSGFYTVKLVQGRDVLCILDFEVR